MDTNIDDLQVKQLKKAWDCIIDQFFDLAKNTSMTEGKGISIFRFLKKKSSNECNCHYFYSRMDSDTYTSIIDTSPEGSLIMKNYDHNSMLLICVQIPINNLSDEETTGNIKLFFTDSRKEVSLYDNEMKSPKENKNEGLRKRNVNSE